MKRVKDEVPDLENAYTLFFDGAYRKTHEAASGGLVLYDPG